MDTPWSRQGLLRRCYRPHRIRLDLWMAARDETGELSRRPSERFRCCVREAKQVMRASRQIKLLLHSFPKCLQGDWCAPGMTVAPGYVNGGAAEENIPSSVLMVLAVYTVKN